MKVNWDKFWQGFTAVGLTVGGLAVFVPGIVKGWNATPSNTPTTEGAVGYGLFLLTAGSAIVGGAIWAWSHPPNG